MDTLFETNAISYDDTPIILIDKSGSTTSNMKSGKTILSAFSDVINKQLSNYKSFHVLFWCTSVFVVDKVIGMSELHNVIEDVNTSKNYERDGTDISVAFKKMPKEWLENSKNIYILTDGDVTDDTYKFSDLVKDMMKKYDDKRLHIISVENNNKDYNKETIGAGNKIYQMVKSNGLTPHVKSFISYNNMYTDKHYVNLYNPDVHEGYVPYEDKCFPVTKLSLFVQYILEENKKAIRSGNKDKINKTIHNLTFTLYHLLKGKALKIQNDIIDMFCALFPMDYLEIRNLLKAEISNHSNGMTNTYQEYQAKRNQLFERANESLTENTAESISHTKQLSLMTIPVRTSTGLTIFECNKADTNVKINTHTFGNAGIKIGSHTIPIFPMTIYRKDFPNQCLRQWIRAVYSKIFGETVNSDIVLYKFLGEVLKVYLSDVNDDVKKGYIEMALVMLDRRRYQSGGIKEIEHLLAGNPPLPVYDDFNAMNHILKECSIEFNVEPYTFWYAVVNMLGDERLVKNQLEYCRKCLIKDQINPKNIIDELKQKMNIKIDCIKIDFPEYDFCDYVTLDDTSETGGYKIKKHFVGDYVCDPKYVVSKETLWTINKCPICHSDINLFDNILPKTEYDIQHNNVEIECDHFNTNKHEIINAHKLTNKLINIDNINFKTASYEFNFPYITKEMSPYSVINGTSKKINDVIKDKYSFLMGLDMSNVCLAGGFCRSVLLGQEVNDYDFFLFGLSDEDIVIRVKKLISDLATILCGVFMVLYKSNTNVLELLRVDNLGKLSHKLQIVLLNHKSVDDIFSRFDLDSCCVGVTKESDVFGVNFCERSEFAYKYMINVVDETMYSPSYDYRLHKYFEKGFSIGVPGFNLNSVNEETTIQLGYCTFDNFVINEKQIIVGEMKVSSSGQISDSPRNSSLYKSFDCDTETTNFIEDMKKHIEAMNKHLNKSKISLIDQFVSESSESSEEGEECEECEESEDSNYVQTQQKYYEADKTEKIEEIIKYKIITHPSELTNDFYNELCGPIKILANYEYRDPNDSWYGIHASTRIINVTSTHHWNKNTRLELTMDGNTLVSRKWYFKKQLSVISNDFDGFIGEFHNLFTLFGCLENIKVDNETLDGVYEIIYNLVIPENYKFVEFKYCCCNMGHCDAIKSYKFKDFKTIGDMISSIGMKKKTKLMTHDYYEYPDSVLLRMDVVRDFNVYEGFCSGKSKYVKLGDDHTYISLGYCR